MRGVVGRRRTRAPPPVREAGVPLSAGGGTGACSAAGPGLPRRRGGVG